MDPTKDVLHSGCQKNKLVAFSCFHKSVDQQLLTGSLKQRGQTNGPRPPTTLAIESTPFLATFYLRRLKMKSAG